jgi:hypothetical protein
MLVEIIISHKSLKNILPGHKTYEASDKSDKKKSPLNLQNNYNVITSYHFDILNRNYITLMHYRWRNATRSH